MKKEILIYKINWRATLLQFSINDIHVIECTPKETQAGKQAISRINNNKIKFTTQMLDNGIKISRIK